MTKENGECSSGSLRDVQITFEEFRFHPIFAKLGLSTPYSLADARRQAEIVARHLTENQELHDHDMGDMRELIEKVKGSV